MMLSERARALQASATAAVEKEARALAAAGVDLVDFGGGEPDFETPLFIKEAGIRAIQAGETRYTDIEGTAQLRLAVRRYFERYYSLQYGDDAVLASVGAKQAILHAAVSDERIQTGVARMQELLGRSL